MMYSIQFVFNVEKSKDGALRDCVAKKDIGSTGVNDFVSRISSTTSSPNPSLTGSITMPPLFPRPSISSSLQRHDNFVASSTSESVISPSFSHPLYSSSFPLFGHRYFSALNHAAATSLLPHQRNINPLMRNLNGPAATYLSTSSGASSTTQPLPFAKSVFAARGCSPSSSQPIEELSSQIFTQVI